MNNELKAVLVIGLVLVGGLGFFVGRASVPGGFLGSQTVNYTNSLNQANLYNEIASVVTDLTAVRAPLAGMVSYTSSTFTIPVFKTNGVATSTISSSTPGASALAGLSKGDFVWASVVTSTEISVIGTVTASDTVSLVFIAPSSSPAFVGGPVGLNVRVLPNASFLVPAALNTVTSTSN